MESDNILRTFAAVSDGAATVNRDVVGPRPFVGLGYSAIGYFPTADQKAKISVSEVKWQPAYQQMREAAEAYKGEGLLRLGWIWFSGTVEVDGELDRFCFPAMSAPLSRPRFEWTLSGAPSVTALVRDLDIREALLARATFGDGRLVDRMDPTVPFRMLPVANAVLGELRDLMLWCRDVSVAVGLRVIETCSLAGTSPIERRFQPGIGMYVGPAMYFSEPAERSSPSLSLSKLANAPGVRQTALASVYGDTGDRTSSREDGEGGAVDIPDRKLISFRPLSTRQREVALRVCGKDLAVISGAPGTGKSHVLSVVAGDAIARGESVLVGAPSANAVDVLVEHFQKTPGPPPLSFGGLRHANRLKDEIAELREIIATGRVDRNQLFEMRERAKEHLEERGERFDALRRAITIEREGRMFLRDDDYVDVAQLALDQAGRLSDLRKLLEKALDPPTRFRRSAVDEAQKQKLVDRLGGHTQLPDRLLRLQVLRDLLAGEVPEPASFDALLDELERSESDAADAGSDLLTSQWLKLMGTAEDLLLTRLIRILDVDPAVRREQLERLSGKGLTTAAPLWIGAVSEVDVVLPPVPGMFDLVILDEAAQLGQIEAASMLGRARRALIVGDPKQIGYRSYLSREAFDSAAMGNQTDADLLNPQSRSTFDVAASQVPTEVLDEHFRSVPHLIGFSAKHFYENRLHVTTRTPANETSQRVHVSLVDGTRGPAKVNVAEVEECMRIVRVYVDRGEHSLAIISPFRRQADALESTLNRSFTEDEITKHRIRVGTVHQYQGDERDIAIISFAIGTDEPVKTWSFVNQNDLFNVMVTRAREQVIVVTSNPEPPGLAGDYVRWAQPHATLVPNVKISDPWTLAVAEALENHGIAVEVGYPVGRYVIDLVAGAGVAAVAIECVPSAVGANAHIDRAMMLRRAGWRTTDAYESRWSNDLDQFIAELRTTFPELFV